MFQTTYRIRYSGLGEDYWLAEGLRELFINVGGSTLLPVHAQLTCSDVEFVRDMLEGWGFTIGDGVFNASRC